MFAYFAYGSNLHPLRLAVRAPAHSVETVAYLPGYQMAFHKRSRIDGSGKCNIVQTGDAGHRVYGVVYKIDEAGFAALDDEEAVHGGYGRIDVAVTTVHGASARAVTYQAPPDLIDESLAPFDWYHRVVVRGAQHHGLPDHYIRRLEAVVARVDSDAGRRRLFDGFLARL